MSPKTRFHSLLEGRVKTVVAEYSASICSGQVQDYPAYREIVGYIRGLNDALRLCDDIEGDLDK